jgi:hypothetical protein
MSTEGHFWHILIIIATVGMLVNLKVKMTTVSGILDNHNDHETVVMLITN